MSIIDRYILKRFLISFVILIGLLFVFAVSIDLILNLDKFVDGARELAGDDGGVIQVGIAIVSLIVDFHGPRFFQFYAYLHGIMAVGAMGFTLAQMHRHRELVAILASGTSLHRLAMPFLFAMFGLSIIQLLNQELILPRFASQLLREHDEVGKSSLKGFAVKFTPDGNGNLFHAPKFSAGNETLIRPTILERDKNGRTIRRITADKAIWSDENLGWKLTNGHAIYESSSKTAGQILEKTNIDLYQTDLTPEVLLVRHHRQFAGMLSLQQIQHMLEYPDVVGTDLLRRYQYSRFAFVLVNLLVMALSLPCFLLREPSNLLLRTVSCASLAVPATIGSAIGMMVDLPGISPAAGVFLPIIILLFVALVPWTRFKT